MLESANLRVAFACCGSRLGKRYALAFDSAVLRCCSSRFSTSLTYAEKLNEKPQSFAICRDSRSTSGSIVAESRSVLRFILGALFVRFIRALHTQYDS